MLAALFLVYANEIFKRIELSLLLEESELQDDLTNANRSLLGTVCSVDSSSQKVPLHRLGLLKLKICL